MVMMLVTICSVCKKEKGRVYYVKEGKYHRPKIEVSHGFCQKHYDEAMKEVKTLK